MVNSDLLTAEKFLKARLSASSALAAVVGTRIYSEIGPGKASYPLVVFKCQGGQDVDTMPGVSLFLDEIYAVKAICTGNSYGPIEAAAAAIQTALQNVTGAVSGGTVLRCQRIAPLKYAELADGVVYRHLGATYRIFSH